MVRCGLNFGLVAMAGSSAVLARIGKAKTASNPVDRPLTCKVVSYPSNVVVHSLVAIAAFNRRISNRSNEFSLSAKSMVDLNDARSEVASVNNVWPMSHGMYLNPTPRLQLLP